MGFIGPFRTTEYSINNLNGYQILVFNSAYFIIIILFLKMNTPKAYKHE